MHIFKFPLLLYIVCPLGIKDLSVNNSKNNRVEDWKIHYNQCAGQDFNLWICK